MIKPEGWHGPSHHTFDRMDRDIHRAANPRTPRTAPQYAGYRTLADLTRAARLAGYAGKAGARHTDKMIAHLAEHGDPQRAAVAAALEAEREGAPPMEKYRPFAAIADRDMWVVCVALEELYGAYKAGTTCPPEEIEQARALWRAAEEERGERRAAGKDV